MPQVGKHKYSYTKAGMKKAKVKAAATGMPVRTTAASYKRKKK